MLALGVAPVQLRRMVRDTLGIGLETSTMASTAAVLSQRQYAMQLPSGLATETIKFVDSQTRCYLAHPRGGVGLGHHSSYAISLLTNVVVCDMILCFFVFTVVLFCDIIIILSRAESVALCRESLNDLGATFDKLLGSVWNSNDHQKQAEQLRSQKRKVPAVFLHGSICTFCTHVLATCTHLTEFDAGAQEAAEAEWSVYPN